MNPTFAGFVEGWDVFRDPVLASLIAGASLGCLGVYIVLRRMVFVSAALSQAAGLGVAFAYYAEIALGASGALATPHLWATAATLLTTMVLVRAGKERWVSRESLLGVVYLAGAAGTLIVGTRIQQEAHEISSILFGTAVLVTSSDLHALCLVCGLAMASQLVFHRGMRLASFERDGASVRGLPVALLEGALFVSIALVVSLSTRVLGALPAFAFSVLPAMAAILVTPSVPMALLVATWVGGLSGAVGYYVAYRGSWPVGASQAAVATLLVALAAVGRIVVRASATLLRPQTDVRMP